jgi:type I restriction enzyme S subunit
MARFGDILKESKVESVDADPNRRITVRLFLKGIEKRPFESGVEGGTKYYTRKAGQFIYGKQNFFKGAFGIIPQELDGFDSSQDIPSFDIREDCLPEYLFYYFKQGEFYKKLESYATGTGSKRIQPSKLADLEIPLPSKAEQKKLIEFANKIEKQFELLSSELRHQSELIAKLRQNILQEAVQGKLVSGKVKKEESAEELLKKIKTEKEKLIEERKIRREKERKPIPYLSDFQLPKNWVLATVEEISYCLDFKRKPINRNERMKMVGDIPYYGANGLVGTIKDYLFDEPLVLVLEDETFIGRTKPFSYIVKGKTWVNNHAHVLKPAYKISAEYLNLLLCFYNFPPLTSGTTNRQKLTKETLLNIQVPVAPLAEQELIVTKVESLMKVCDDIEKEVEVSKRSVEELMQSILRETFENKN